MVEDEGHVGAGIDGGVLAIDQAFEAVPVERTFNLVPGFECVALEVAMEVGKDVRVRLEKA